MGGVIDLSCALCCRPAYNCPVDYQEDFSGGMPPDWNELAGSWSATGGELTTSDADAAIEFDAYVASIGHKVGVDARGTADGDCLGFGGWDSATIPNFLLIELEVGASAKARVVIRDQANTQGTSIVGPFIVAEVDVTAAANAVHRLEAAISTELTIMVWVNGDLVIQASVFNDGGNFNTFEYSLSTRNLTGDAYFDNLTLYSTDEEECEISSCVWPYHYPDPAPATLDLIVDDFADDGDFKWSNLNDPGGYELHETGSNCAYYLDGLGILYYSDGVNPDLYIDEIIAEPVEDPYPAVGDPWYAYRVRFVDSTSVVPIVLEYQRLVCSDPSVAPTFTDAPYFPANGDDMIVAYLGDSNSVQGSITVLHP